MRCHNSSGTSGAVQEGTCVRCHGFMVPSFTDSLLVETTENSSAPALRCVNCGDWIDPTVATNRSARRSDEADRHRLASFSRQRGRW